MRKIIKLIDSSLYEDNSKGLRLLLNKTNINNSELYGLLHNGNHLVVGEFLLNYKFFTKHNMSEIHNFILQNLTNNDKLFVSDLIDFATENQLSLPQDKCCRFLEDCGGDSDYAQIAFLDYLLYGKSEIINKKIEHLLVTIIENNCCSIYSQLRACILLYSLRHQRQYLLKVIAYTQIDDACKTLLRNIVKSNLSNEKISRSFYMIPDEIIQDKLTILYPAVKPCSCKRSSSLLFNSYGDSVRNG